MLSDVELLFMKHDCECVVVEVTDTHNYTALERNPVIPDAVKKVNFTFYHLTMCVCKV